MTRVPVAAAILAGGDGRRMGGVAKPLLVIDQGRPHGDGTAQGRIIDRQLQVLQQVTDHVFIVSNDAASYRSLGLPIVADALPHRGALSGIYTAIVRSPRERTLVVAGDLPFLQLALLERLTDDGGADVVIPRSARGYEPLCAVYSKACAEGMRARLEAGDFRASELPAGVRIEAVGVDALAAVDPDGLSFVNVNTPHDYERARGLFESLLQPREDRITDKHSTS